MRILTATLPILLLAHACLANSIVNVTIHVYDASTLALVPCRMLVETLGDAPSSLLPPGVRARYKPPQYTGAPHEVMPEALGGTELWPVEILQNTFFRTRRMALATALDPHSCAVLRNFMTGSPRRASPATSPCRRAPCRCA